MRIVTRPDFDGVVCAVVLEEALTHTERTLWVEPNDMQQGTVEIREGDVIANLPYDSACSLWFDHHATNRVETPFEGAFGVAPSAAGLVWGYYKDRIKKDFSELIRQADRIDSADLTRTRGGGAGALPLCASLHDHLWAQRGGWLLLGSSGGASQDPDH